MERVAERSGLMPQVWCNLALPYGTHGTDAAAVTPEFVRVYGSARVQNIYRNLSALRCFDGETMRQACERRLRVYCGGGAITRFDTQYERMSMLTHARLLHETLRILEHLNVDIDTDHLQNATISRKTLESELDALDNEFVGRAEYNVPDLVCGDSAEFDFLFGSPHQRRPKA